MPTEGFTPFDDYGSDSSIRGLVAGQKVLNRYTLKRVLGRGGMGVVWLVHDEQLDRDIAFKFLPDIVYHDKAAVESLKRETRRSLELTHPNIVRIYDFAQDDQCAGISMEYVAGDTLSNLRVCQPTHVFEVSDVEKWMRQLCLALHYAHREARVAHRDLKPANLMLNNRGVLKIADFGISRSISDNMTRVSSAVHGASGTLVYMSPQQALGEAASAQDDIYSLGATLFELLTSKPPFFTGEIMAQVREKIPPTMAERRKQLGIMGKPIPPEWEETVAACLAKDPAKRPQGAMEVLQRLGLADTAGLEAAGQTTTQVGEEAVAATSPVAPAEESAKTEPIPMMQISEPEEQGKTTTKPVPPPMEFIIDSKGIRPAGAPNEQLVPETTKPQRVARRSAAVMVMCLLVFMVGLAWWVNTEGSRLKSGTGGIEVTSLPEGATVKLANGQSMSGVGKFMNLPPGVYQVTVEQPLHEPQNLTLEVQQGKFTTLPPVSLPAFIGRVVLASDPPGAVFSAQGQPVKPDTNGTMVAVLSPGIHEITAQYPGWPPIKRQVTVTKDGETSEVFEFYPGTVMITSEPSGAKVYAGTNELGSTPLPLTNVPPGDVMYVLVKDDFNPETVKGEVRGKQVLPLHRTLTKERGTLLLSSLMPGVDVYLDSRFIGQLSAGSKLETNVSPGRHEVTAILQGWPKQERTIDVIRDKVNAMSFEFAPAAVVVSSVPSGASVIMRGTNIGTTPLTMKEVRPGIVNLLVQMDGFDPVTLETNVLSGETLALQATMQRMSRPFRIRMTPPDANISLDGIPVTNRPPSFAVGSHLLRVEKEGYEAREAQVEIKADGYNDLGEYILERASGDLQILTDPANAVFEITVGGVTKKAKSAEKIPGVPVGKHRIIVKAEGYDPLFVDVEINKNEMTISDMVTLVRSKGTMRVLTTPDGAGYSLIGPDQVMRSGKTPNDELNLPTGTYQVTFTMVGFESTNRTVEVHSQGTVAAEVSLRRSQAPLRITVSMAGANYQLNGPDGIYREGTLPLIEKAMVTGSYKLEVNKEGYERVVKTFELKKGENVPVNIELVRSKGTLLATISPSEATTFLNGGGLNKAVTSDVPLDQIPTGDYQLVSRYKQWSVTNNVTIQPGKVTKLPVALPFGAVMINSEPAGAVVMRGNEELGVTPLRLDELPVGTAKFQLRLPRHRFVDVAVTVQEQKTLPVKRTLEAYPGPQPGMTEWVNSLGMKFVPVGNLWVCVWETRKKDFETFYNDTRYNAGADWRDPGFKQTATEPVVDVNWNDAQAFCQWLTERETSGKVLEQAQYRLPTQAEWMQALKEGYPAGTYLWGNAWPAPSESANLAENISYDRYSFTAPAGSYFPSKNGIYDLIGNVWEWCQDGSRAERTLLGESWLQYPGSDYSPGTSRSVGKEMRGTDIGFRVVLVPVPAK